MDWKWKNICFEVTWWVIVSGESIRELRRKDRWESILENLAKRQLFKNNVSNSLVKTIEENTQKGQKTWIYILSVLRSKTIHYLTNVLI